MSRNDKIEFYVYSISEFAKCVGVPTEEAYDYLQNFGGLSFMLDCYDAEHTLSLEDVVEDLASICKRNGGTYEIISWL